MGRLLLILKNIANKKWLYFKAHPAAGINKRPWASCSILRWIPMKKTVIVSLIWIVGLLFVAGHFFFKYTLTVCPLLAVKDVG